MSYEVIEFEKYIADNATELTETEIEDLYMDELDGIYSFKAVGGPFTSMSPGQVLREMSPTDFRIGCSEFEDSLSESGYIELGEKYYDPDHFRLIAQDFIDEQEAIVEDIDEEIAGLDEDDDSEQIEQLEAIKGLIEKQIEIAEDHV